MLNVINQINLKHMVNKRRNSAQKKILLTHSLIIMV